MKIGLLCLSVLCLCFTVSGMEFLEVCIPSPGSEHFTKKCIGELTRSDIEKIHSVPSYEKQLLEMVDRLRMTILAFQQQGTDDKKAYVNSSSVCNGTISAIHDYLIDEANPSNIPVVCSLMDDLMGEGVSKDSPDLLFFRGVILYNSEFLAEVPSQYFEILIGAKEEVVDYKTFGLQLIRQAEEDGCSDAAEYLLNI